MTRPAKPHPTNIVEGPSVSRWHCPCCGEDVPRLLPNGMLNRHRFLAADAWLAHPDTESAAHELGAEPGFDICLGCRDTVRQLLGTLLVPADEEADLLVTSGKAGTGIIGAVLPEVADETLICVFDADDDGRLVVDEVIPLSQFDPRRMTYPTHRGAIDPAVWSAYQAELEKIRDA